MESIVVALDGSPSSERALALSVSLATKFNSRLTLVHVAEPLFVPPEPFGFNSAAIESSNRDYGRKVLDEATAKAREAGIEAQTVLVVGAPADELLQAAERLDASVIVIGSRGQGRVGRLLLGSVSDRVLHHARASVLVVH